MYLIVRTRRFLFPESKSKLLTKYNLRLTSFRHEPEFYSDQSLLLNRFQGADIKLQRGRGKQTLKRPGGQRHLEVV